MELQKALLETGFFRRKGIGVSFKVSLKIFLRCGSRGWELCGLDWIEDVAEAFDQFVQTKIVCPVA